MTTAPLVLFRSRLPDWDLTQLLRAALLPPEEAAAAWRDWEARDARSAVERLRAMGRGVRLLAPLLGRPDLSLDPELHRATRVAELREGARAARIAGVTAAAVDTLERAGVPSVVLPGVAVAHEAYPDRWMRHCHDVDLLVPAGASDRAGAVVRAASPEAYVRPRASRASPVVVQHPSGVVVSLHDGLVYGAPAGDAVWSRRREERLEGAPVSVLSPEDALVHLCGHGLARSWSRSPLQVCDAWFLLDRHGRDLRWDLLRGAAAEARRLLHVQAGLGYLRGALGAEVPPVLFAASGRGERPAQVEAAVTDLLRSPRGRPDEVRRLALLEPRAVGRAAGRALGRRLLRARDARRRGRRSRDRAGATWR